MVSQFVVSAATPTTVRIISTQKPEKVGSKEKLKNVLSFFKPRSYRHFFIRGDLFELIKILFIKTTKRSKQTKLFSDCCKDFSVTKKTNKFKSTTSMSIYCRPKHFRSPWGGLFYNSFPLHPNVATRLRLTVSRLHLTLSGDESFWAGSPKTSF